MQHTLKAAVSDAWANHPCCPARATVLTLIIVVHRLDNMRKGNNPFPLGFLYTRSRSASMFSKSGVGKVDQFHEVNF